MSFDTETFQNKTSPDSTDSSNASTGTMSGTDPSYAVLPPNTQPTTQTGSGETRSQTTEVANAQGVLTPEQQMNKTRQEQGLAPIQYGSDASSAVSGTDSLRAEQDANKASASDLMTSTTNMTGADANLTAINDQQAYGDTAEGKQMISNINDMTAKLASGTLTPEEQAKVQADKDATKAQYDALIAKAEMEKKQGMAKDLVAAGQRGGLMNTQFAGVAALRPTVGGNFVGAGGELNRMQSEYDLNIQDLQAKQLQAVTDAQKAAELAIKTGKQEDLQNAMDAFNFAKGVQDDHNKMVTDKIAAVQDYQTKQLEVQKYQRDTAAATVDAMVKAGVDPDSLPAGYLDDLDKQAGYAPGTSKGLWEVGQKELVTKNKNDELDQADKMVSVLEKLPAGTSVKVGDTTYTSLQKGDVQLISTDDGDGNTTVISWNKDTGESTSQTFSGVSKVDGWETKTENGVTAFVNARTGEVRTISDSSQPNNGQPTNTGIYAAFPDGTEGGECVVFSENTTDFKGYMDGPDGKDHTFAAKMKNTDPDISIEKGNVTPGMIGVLNMGAYGHVVDVLGVSTIGGVTKVKVMESNKNGDGKVHLAEYNADQIKGYIPTHFKSEYAFGSGVTPSTIDIFSGTAKNDDPEAKAQSDRLSALYANATNETDRTNILAKAKTLGLDPSEVEKNAYDVPQPKGVYVNKATGLRADLSEKQIDGFSGANASLKMFDDLLKSNGKFQGEVGDVLSGGFISDRLLTPAARNARISFKDQLNAFNMKYKKAISGLTVTDTEAKAFKDLLPSINDSPSKRAQKMRDAQKAILDAQEEAKSALGIDQVIEVKDKDGNVGTIPESEFDASKYTRT